MSATGRQMNGGAKTIRAAQDAYQTPIWCVERLLEHIYPPQPFTFVEPCRGDGNIWNAVRDTFHPTKMRWAEISKGRNYLTKHRYDGDLLITNPPYHLAMEFLTKSLAECHSVMYLLRLNILGSKSRQHFWNDGANRPTHVLPLSDRPSFMDVCKGTKTSKPCGATYKTGATKKCANCWAPVGPGTDATEYAWFCWDRDNKFFHFTRWLYVL